MKGRGSALRRRATAALLATALMSAARPGRPAPAPPRSGPVVLLHPLGSSTGTQQCLTRIRDELVAGGFEVSIVDPGPHRDPVSLAGVMKAQHDAIATIALVGEPDGPGAELWILDRTGRNAEVRRIAAAAEDRDRVAEVLAIRTIEVLTASALKLMLESEPRPPPPVSVAAAAAPSPKARGRGFGLEAGLALLENVGGPGPALVPLLRARAGIGDSLFARLTIGGLGTRPRVGSAIGSASVSQSIGLAELVVAFRPARRWRPTLSLGGGATHVEIDGEGVWPYEGVRTSHWGAAVDAGFGLLLELPGTLSLAFEVHGLVGFPHGRVHFDELEVAKVGLPALLGSLTMVAWLP